MTTSGQSVKSPWTLTMASTTVVVAAVYLAKGVLVPLTLAVLLSFLLTPVCDVLERWKVRRIPAVLVTASLGFAVLGAVAWTAVVQVSNLAPKMPEYQANLQAKFHSVDHYFIAALNKVTRSAEEMEQGVPEARRAEAPQGSPERPYSVRVLSTPLSPLEVVGGTFGTLVEALGFAGVVIVLVVFFLVGREDLRDRFIRLVGRGQVTMTTKALEDAAQRVSQFLSMLLLVNVTFGIAVGVGLYLIGVPNAILWGILAAAMRFIPYIGVWIAGAAPIALSMAISTNWVAPILTLGLFVVLELFISNVMEPWLYGKRTGVSPVAVLVAAVFWTWLWGPVGLLLATPLTVCLLVIGKYVPQLSFLDTLLGDEPVFEPKTRVYQRLLAGDQEEAVEVVEAFLAQMPLVEVYDTVLVPALALTGIHWHRGELDEGRHQFILQGLRASVEELGERWEAIQAKEEAAVTKQAGTDAALAPSTSTPKQCILCLPAHDEADEIAGMMVAQLLEMEGCQVHALSVTAPASEMMDLIQQHRDAVVCISAMPPAGVMHARYLCRRLCGRFPGLNLVVGLWNAKGDLGKAKEHIGCGASSHVVGTLAEAQERIGSRFQPPLPDQEKQLQPAGRLPVVEGGHQ